MAERKNVKVKRYSKEETVTIKANVTLKKDEYEKYKSGKTKSNKGLRGDDGKLSSIPDFEEIQEDENYYAEDSRMDVRTRDRSLKEVIIEEVVAPALGIAAEKVTEEIVDAAVMAIDYVWKNAVVPVAKKGAKAVSSKAKEIKENHHERKQKKQEVVTSKQIIIVKKRTKTTEKTVRHTPEEVDMILQNMRNAAMYIAAGIRELTNTLVVDSENPEKAIELQNNIARLSSDEAISVINFMLEDKNRELLDEASRRLFEEFRNRNLIIDDKVVPISNYISGSICNR